MAFTGMIGVLAAVIRNQAYLYMNEMSPTNFRGIFVGTACFIGKNGAALAPFIINWLEFRKKPIQDSFTFISILGIIFITCGNETFGKKLAMEAEDEDEDHFHQLELIEEVDEDLIQK